MNDAEKAGKSGDYHQAVEDPWITSANLQPFSEALVNGLSKQGVPKANIDRLVARGCAFVVFRGRVHCSEGIRAQEHSLLRLGRPGDTRGTTSPLIWRRIYVIHVHFLTLLHRHSKYTVTSCIPP